MSQKSEALQFSMKFDKDKMWLFSLLSNVSINIQDRESSIFL